MTTVPERGGFVAFYRRYTKTWLHALATAALTAFGTLSIVHRGFALLAVAAYVVPPLVLYFAWPTLSGTRRLPGTDADPEEVDPAEAGPERADSPEADPGRTESDADPTRTARDSDRPPGERAAESEGGDPATDDAPPGRWTAVDVPTEAALHDAAVAAGGAYAVGEGGVVLADDGDGWATALPDGPGAAANTLHGVDATADGEAVWVAGDGGAVGRLERGTGRHVDHSAPGGRTDSWTAVAVGGPAADELILLVNGSGEVVRGRYRDGDLFWNDPSKPGSGSSMSGVSLADGATGYCCDTNDGVFETTDGGETFARVGIEAVEGTPTDVTTAGGERTLVSSDAGLLYRRDGGTWTPVRLGDGALAAVAVADGRGVACGDDAVYERTNVGDWERSPAPGAGPFAGVAVGATRAVVVGVGGHVLESA